jgi:hypothetical protein
MIRAASLLLVLTACATTQVPARDRMHVDLRYTNEVRQLRASVLVTPFFRDASRRLLLQQPPEETELLVTGRGAPISPGPVQEVLPAGTRMRVLKVRFPTGWESFTRPLMTPRERTWVELTVEGRGIDVAYTIAMRPDLKSEDEVVAEMDKWLTIDDVAAEVAQLPEADRKAVETRTASAGIHQRALELAFGPPLVRRIQGEGASVTEEWVWRSDLGTQHVASVVDGVVRSYETVVPEKKAVSP